jgi:hypothetical protein
MSRKRRNSAPDRSLMGLALALVLSGLVIFTIACQDLDSSPPTSTETTTAAAQTDLGDLRTTVFGSWDGTYTPTAAWDDIGSVKDPPFTLGEPLAMHMELRPWSDASLDYGTVSVAGVPGTRVTMLTINGDQIRLKAVTQQSGLEDLLSVFALTLAGDTLAGEDSGDSGVPQGWVSTSGTIFLTRTVPWDPTATTAPTAGAPAASAPVAGDSHEADDEPTTTTAAPLVAQQQSHAVEPPDWNFTEADKGHHKTVAVGDTISVQLNFTVADAVTSVTWTSTAPSKVRYTGSGTTVDVPTHHHTLDRGYFDVLGPGAVGLIALARRADGSVFEMWQVYLEVTE